MCRGWGRWGESVEGGLNRIQPVEMDKGMIKENKMI